MTIKNYTATVEAGDKFEAICRARDHEIIIDEPLAAGGNDLGMTPVEALLSSIGAWKTATAKGFSKKLRLDLKSFKIKLDGEIDTEKGRGLSKVKTTYYIGGDISKEQVDKFVDLIERYCTVEITILNAPEFEKEVIQL